MRSGRQRRAHDAGRRTIASFANYHPDWENRTALDPPGEVISKALSASGLSEIVQVKSKDSQTACCVSNEDSSAIRQGAQSVTTEVRPWGGQSITHFVFEPSMRLSN